MANHGVTGIGPQAGNQLFVQGKPADKLTYDEIKNILKNGGDHADIYAYAANMLGWAKTPVPPPPPTLGAAVVTSTGPSTNFNSTKLCNMICMRMRFAEGQKLPMAFMEAHLSKDTVFVFMVHDHKPVVIEDEWNLFPSDSLITKIRLILG